MCPVMQQVKRDVLIKADICCIPAVQPPIAQVIAQDSTLAAAFIGASIYIKKRCIVTHSATAEPFAQAYCIRKHFIKRSFPVVPCCNVGDNGVPCAVSAQT